MLWSARPSRQIILPEEASLGLGAAPTGKSTLAWVPGGMVTFSVNRSACRCQSTLISPCGHGTVPRAKVRLQSVGRMAKVEKPGAVGVTPRILLVIWYVGEAIQPWL